MNGSGQIDPLSQRTDSLVSRTNQAVDALLSRFTAIVESASVDASDTRANDVSIAATNALQIEHQANMMARAAEDLRTIIREVKEHWVLAEGSQLQARTRDPPEATSQDASDVQIRYDLVQEGLKALASE